MAAAILPCAACIVWFVHTQPASLRGPGWSESVTVLSPVKAHLADGGTVVFRGGVGMIHDTLWGEGYRFGLSLRDSTRLTSLPLDSVVAMETFQRKVDAAPTVVASTLATAGGALLVAGVAVAIACASNPKCFGSCPTFYSDSAGHDVLEAEGFSYSIAPLLEARDVDRLRAAAVRDTVGLEVRDEALETHYINSLALLELRHGRDELVLPDERGHPLAVRDLTPVSSAVDRRGRDQRAVLARDDGIAFRTDPHVLDAATVGDLDDYLDLTLAAPTGADSVALVFRMRNSLLNTVLLYDMMLGAQGLHALDWQARDLQQVGPAAQLGRWYVTHFGLRVAVRDGAGYREVARVADTGPVAWKDVAVVVPAPTGDVLHLRLTFVADDWRIDAVRAGRYRRPAARAVPAGEIIGSDGRPDTTALASVATTDARYLQTSAGDRFTIRFAVGPAPADSTRTFLLVSQGYYTEWLRGAWIRNASATPFVLSDETLLATLRRWRAEQRDLERRFARTRVPVR